MSKHNKNSKEQQLKYMTKFTIICTQVRPLQNTSFLWKYVDVHSDNSQVYHAFDSTHFILF